MGWTGTGTIFPEPQKEKSCPSTYRGGKAGLELATPISQPKGQGQEHVGGPFLSPGD